MWRQMATDGDKTSSGQGHIDDVVYALSTSVAGPSCGPSITDVVYAQSISVTSLGICLGPDISISISRSSSSPQSHPLLVLVLVLAWAPGLDVPGCGTDC